MAGLSGVGALACRRLGGRFMAGFEVAAGFATLNGVVLKLLDAGPGKRVDWGWLALKLPKLEPGNE